MSTGESCPPPFQGRRFLLLGALPNGATVEPFDSLTPNTRGPRVVYRPRYGDDWHPAQAVEEKYT